MELEPDLRDVYVEARPDANFVRWYLRGCGVAHPSVYAIDDRVVVDAERVLACGGEIGPRGRLMALAAEVGVWSVGTDMLGLTCIVDADRDYVFPSTELSQLSRTDVGSLDVYAFQERPLQQFFDLVLGTREAASGVIEELLPVLNELFLIRALLHLDGPDIPMLPSFVACCEFTRSGVRVDSREVLRRSLAIVGEGGRLGSFLARLEALRGKLPPERLKAVRGHDIAPLLIARLGLKNDWAKPLLVEQAWRGCLSPEDLHPWPLFEELRRRVAAPLDLK